MKNKDKKKNEGSDDVKEGDETKSKDAKSRPNSIKTPSKRTISSKTTSNSTANGENSQNNAEPNSSNLNDNKNEKKNTMKSGNVEKLVKMQQEGNKGVKSIGKSVMLPIKTSKQNNISLVTKRTVSRGRTKAIDHVNEDISKAVEGIVGAHNREVVRKDIEEASIKERNDVTPRGVVHINENIPIIDEVVQTNSKNIKASGSNEDSILRVTATPELLALQGNNHYNKQLNNDQFSKLVAMSGKQDSVNSASYVNISMTVQGDLSLVDEVFSYLELDDTGTLPVFFDVRNVDFNYSDNSNTVNENVALMPSLPVINKTRMMMSPGRSHLLKEWSPKGWNITFNDLYHDTDVTPIDVVYLIPPTGRSKTAIEKFNCDLSRYCKLISINRVVLKYPKFYVISQSVNVLTIDNRTDYTQIIRSGVQEQPMAITNTELSCIVPIGIISSCLTNWRRFAFDTFVNAGAYVLTGRTSEDPENSLSVFGSMYGFTDTYSALVLNSSFQELTDNKMTRGWIDAVGKCFTHTGYDLQIDNRVDSKRFLKYEPSNDDTRNLLFILLMCKNYRSACFEYVSEIFHSMGLFQMVEKDTLFTAAFLGSVSAGKTSDYLTEVSSYYSSGSLESFYKIITMEHFSWMFEVEFKMRRIDNTYLTWFNVLDVLLAFIVIPKLMWSNSAAIGGMLHTCLHVLDRSALTEFQDSCGMIVEYNENNVWVKSEKPQIVQDDVRGVSGRFFQWAILVVPPPDTLSRHTREVFEYITLIRMNGTYLSMNKRRTAEMPYTSNALTYYCSWQGNEVLNPINVVPNDGLSTTMRSIVTYIHSRILDSKSTSQLFGISRDNATLQSLFEGISNNIKIFASALSRFGLVLSSLVCNTPYIFHEWFTADNYVFAQPIVSLGVVQNRQVTTLPIVLDSANIALGAITYCALTVVGIDDSLNQKVNSDLHAKGLVSKAITVPLLDISTHVSRYIDWCYSAKLEIEKLSIIMSWFTDDLFIDATANFRGNLKLKHFHRYAEFIASELDCEIYDLILDGTISNAAGRDKLHIVGLWTPILTTLYASTDLSATLIGNRAFLYDLLITGEHFNRMLPLYRFLSFGDTNPGYTVTNGVVAMRAHSDILDPYAAYPIVDVGVVINSTDLDYRDGITRIVTSNEGTLVNPITTRIVYVLGNYEFPTSTAIVNSGIRVALIVDAPKNLIARDLDIIHDLVISGVMTLIITDIKVKYQIIPTEDPKNYYSEETNAATSWLRNTLMVADANKILDYALYDVRKPIISYGDNAISYTRYVFPLNRLELNIILENISENAITSMLIPRSIATDIWRPNNAQTVNDIPNILTQSFTFNSPLAYVTNEVYAELPDITVSIA